jgi:hypothetical protein
MQSNLKQLSLRIDRLCGLVVKFLAVNPQVPGSIPGAIIFVSNSGSGTGSTQPL